MELIHFTFAFIISSAQAGENWGDRTRVMMRHQAASLIALAALCEGYGLSPAPRCATRRAVGALLPAGCWLLGRDAAAGACLPSDLSEECIGVYKERSTDVTREDARAAGIRWAEQPTFAKPREAARALRRERAVVTAWRRDSDLVNVGTSLLRVRPVVGAAAEAVGAKLDRETAKLWAKAVDASLFAFDAADVALGYAIRERDAREIVARNVAADDLLKVAADEYLQLLRFLDVVAPETDADRSDESREARRALAAEAARQRKRART